jgi:hypothetical protein
MAEAVRCGAEVSAALRELMVARFRSAGVDDEGGFAPAITTPEQALDLLVEAIEQAGYRPGGEVQLALDPAANGLLSGDASHLGDGAADTGELIGRYQRLLATYPIRSIEDDLAVAAGVGQLKTGAPARASGSPSPTGCWRSRPPRGSGTGWHTDRAVSSDGARCDRLPADGSCQRRHRDREVEHEDRGPGQRRPGPCAGAGDTRRGSRPAGRRRGRRADRRGRRPAGGAGA